MKKVLLLMCKGTEIYEAAAFYDVFGWAKTEGNAPVELITVGLTKEIRCTFGLRVIIDALLSEINPDDFAALAVPGGFESDGFYEEAFSKPVIELIQKFNAAEKPIAAICVGALPLAKSGILTNKKATTYHLMGGKRKIQLAELGAIPVEEAMVVSDNICTSTCPVTAIDVAFWLLEQVTSAENANYIRGIMGFGINSAE